MLICYELTIQSIITKLELQPMKIKKCITTDSLCQNQLSYNNYALLLMRKI